MYIYIYIYIYIYAYLHVCLCFIFYTDSSKHRIGWLHEDITSISTLTTTILLHKVWQLQIWLLRRDDESHIGIPCPVLAWVIDSIFCGIAKGHRCTTSLSIYKNVLKWLLYHSFLSFMILRLYSLEILVETPSKMWILVDEMLGWNEALWHSCMSVLICLVTIVGCGIFSWN